MNLQQGLLTLREAAMLLRICMKKLRGIIAKGELKAFKVGRQWRIRVAALEEYQAMLEAKFAGGADER